MSNPIHCDNCEKEAPPLLEARETGWYLSARLSVSGIPWDVTCPECREIINKLTLNPDLLSTQSVDKK